MQLYKQNPNYPKQKKKTHSHQPVTANQRNGESNPKKFQCETVVESTVILRNLERKREENNGG